MEFKKVGSISLPQRDTINDYNGLFLTFDLDWCHEDVLHDTIELIDKYDATATFFVTNKLSCLSGIETKPNIELGIHPNCNPLFSIGANRGETDAESIIDDLLNIVPSALSVRSHSLVTSTRLTKMFFKKGLTHESNIKITKAAVPAISPFIHPSGMIICPY